MIIIVYILLHFQSKTRCERERFPILGEANYDTQKRVQADGKAIEKKLDADAEVDDGKPSRNYTIRAVEV